MRQNGCAGNGHDHARAPELGVFAQTPDTDSIDRGKHERHASGYAHQGINAPGSGPVDRSQATGYGDDTHPGKQVSGPDVLHQERAYETGTDKQNQRQDIVGRSGLFGGPGKQGIQPHALGQGVKPSGNGFDMPQGIGDLGRGRPITQSGNNPVEMQRMHGITDHERPGRNLGSHVEELRDNAPDIVPIVQQSAHGPLEIDRLVLLLQIRHPGQIDGGQNTDHHQTQNHIGHRHGIELLALNARQLLGRQSHTLRRRHRVELGKDENLGKHHPGDRAERIERLGKIQPPRRRGLRSDGADVRVGRGLQDGESGKQDKYRNQEGQEPDPDTPSANQHRRIEQERAQGIKSQPQHDTGLVRIAFDEQCSGNGEAPVAEQIAHDLYPCRFRVREAHDPLEGRQHRIRHVVGNGPGKEENRKQRERPDNSLRNNRLLFHSMRY